MRPLVGARHVAGVPEQAPLPVARVREHHAVATQGDRARLAVALLLGELRGAAVGVEDRHGEAGQLGAHPRCPVGRADARRRTCSVGSDHENARSACVMTGRCRPGALEGSSGSGTKSGCAAFSATSRASSTAASVTRPVYRALLRSGAAGSRKVRVPQTGPASISAIADSAVTPTPPRRR